MGDVTDRTDARDYRSDDVTLDVSGLDYCIILSVSMSILEKAFPV